MQGEAIYTDEHEDEMKDWRGQPYAEISATNGIAVF